VWFHPGLDAAIDNFGAFRLTVPIGGDGDYDVTTSVRTYLDGAGSGDSDFHVVKNGIELFGQFVPGDSGTSFSNRLTLASGDTIDFLAGRGADGHLYASGLKIEATVNRVVPPPSPPSITAQPQTLTVEVARSATFSVTAQGSAP